MIETPSATRRLRVGRLAVEVYADRSGLGAAAASAAGRRMREILERQERCRIVFAAAPSQNEYLAGLAEQEGIDWSRVTAFHMDEYAGLPNDHPQSFVRFLREHLWDRVQPGEIHPLNGLNPDPEDECRRYTELLRAAPIDIVAAGIGENGHLAFNDPPADFETERPYLVVTLDEACRRQQVGEGWFAALADVPSLAISMSVRQILKARTIVAVVPDARKADAVAACLCGPVSPMAPASILRGHSDTSVYLDQDSAALLPEAMRGELLGDETA